MSEIDRKELEAEIKKLAGLSRRQLVETGMNDERGGTAARAAAELLEPETILEILHKTGTRSAHPFDT